jgi:DNA ligase D-like protein (predicted 3'-phosphoesterase)
MAENRSLEEYRKRRDFRKTGEPAGKPGAGRKTEKRKPLFVIQKHAARSLHYDFRLEVAGVLKSWAVPKGPSTDPADKRLAVPTEDHPLEYADFEGVIPEGEYGAGAVLVWDTGSYRNLSAEKEDPVSMEAALEKGHVEVWLEGKKLTGGYALVRTAGDNRWLLIKMKDERADAGRNPVSTDPDSVLSGRSLEEIRKEEAREQGQEGRP